MKILFSYKTIGDDTNFLYISYMKTGRLYTENTVTFSSMNKLKSGFLKIWWSKRI